MTGERMRLTHLSLFSGIGGLDIAAEMAGFETVGQCEFADYPYKVLSKHWPEVQKWRDIRTLTGEDFYAKTGLRTVDVVSGGFPCQPFSCAGKRRGAEDDRYLWPEMLRVIEEIRPAWVIGENVAGIVNMAEPIGDVKVENRTINRLEDEDFYEAVLSQQERMLFGHILQELEDVGYEVQPFVIPACATDAAHRRDRVAIVGYSEHNGLFTTKNPGGVATPCGNEQEGQNKTGEPARASGRKNGEDVAHADEQGLQGRERGELQKCTGERIAGKGSTYVSDGECGGWSMRRYRELSEAPKNGEGRNDNGRRAAKHVAREWWAVESGVGGVAHGIPAWMDGYWVNEPDIPRVATGVPNRVERLKGLGNAVYWRQFYPIFKAIAMIEQGYYDE